MSKLMPLQPSQLRRRCDPARFSFSSTAELDDLHEALGQQRAMEALRFGVGIPREGYNLFALGPPGVGKRATVERFLAERAAAETRPSDWCYVNNFDEPHKPSALRLPAGKGSELRRDMERLVEDLQAAIPAAFDNDEYRTQRKEIEQEFEGRHERALEELAAHAAEHDLRLLRTPSGLSVAPTRGGQILSPEEFAKLSAAEQAEIQAQMTAHFDRIRNLFREVTQWGSERREQIRELDRRITTSAVGHLLASLKEKYAARQEVLAYLERVERDVVENAAEFRKSEEEAPVVVLGLRAAEAPSFLRYQVNVVVDHADTRGAPVVYEDHPTLENLVGRIEHVAQLGALLTNFTLIKAGALHRANGGYLILDARKVLLQPFAWEGLKRALKALEVRADSLGRMLSLVSTVSLEPEAIPLGLKVVLLGDPLLYYLLQPLDPDFHDLFKVAVDFDASAPRGPESELLHARLIGTLARREGLKPFDASAVALVLEEASRATGDAEKLSVHMESFTDLLREAEFWAADAGRAIVTGPDVRQAVAAREHRADRLRERLHEEILKGRLLVDTEGTKVGQVNALSVIDLWDFRFAQPSRVTATARVGEGTVVDIEREAKLGGPLHSKGVLILSHFLAARYAKNRPLSMAASLVFEQSYGVVEGDSASLAEACALLSVLAEAPIRQFLAVTGSLNQLGEVQPIGAVNEKVEGFFDICRARGLTGEHGVLIPAANAQGLMLRDDVVEAAAEGAFHVYAVASVDDAIELLTGVPAGERDAAGRFPAGTVHRRVEDRLAELSSIRQVFSLAARTGSGARDHEEDRA